MSLNARQRKFAEVYDGNGVASARQAGYRGSDQAMANQAKRLMKNGEVLALIQARERVSSARDIATREDRQRFWSRTMSDTGAELGARLKASELLGKSEADFVERHELEGPGWADIIEAAMARKAAK